MPDPLADAARAAEKARVWTERRDAALLAAQAEGASLRVMASAVGASPQSVANWLAKAEVRTARD